METLEQAFINRNPAAVIHQLQELAKSREHVNKILLLNAKLVQLQHSNRQGVIVPAEAEIVKSNILSDLKEIARNYVSLDEEKISAAWSRRARSTSPNSGIYWKKIQEGHQWLTPVEQLYKDLLSIHQSGQVGLKLYPRLADNSGVDQQYVADLGNCLSNYTIAEPRPSVEEKSYLQTVASPEASKRLYLDVMVRQLHQDLLDRVEPESPATANWDIPFLEAQRRPIESELLDAYLQYFRSIIADHPNLEMQGIMLEGRLNNLKNMLRTQSMPVENFIQDLSRIKQAIDALAGAV